MYGRGARRWVTRVAALCALCGAAAMPRVSEAVIALPAGIPEGSTLVFTQSGFLTDMPLRVEFDVPSAGLVTVNLTDLGFPRPFECLTFLLTSGSTVLGEVLAGSPFSFQLGTPAHLFGFLQGDPQGPQNRGTYLLQVAVEPGGVVPLPAGAWLLLSGVGGLALLMRRRGRSS